MPHVSHTLLRFEYFPAHRRQKGASTCSLDNSLEHAGHRTFGSLLKQPPHTSDQWVVLRGKLHSSQVIERLTDLLTDVVSFTSLNVTHTVMTPMNSPAHLDRTLQNPDCPSFSVASALRLVKRPAHHRDEGRKRHRMPGSFRYESFSVGYLASRRLLVWTIGSRSGHQ